MDATPSAECRHFKTAIDLLTKPWAGHILRTLQGGPLRFNELATRIEGIGEKVLSARLKELEAMGILVRRVCPTTPVKVEYELTCKGQGFGQVVEAIIRWGAQIAECEVKAG
jgi:DNA-binding HxlR family transcriptional regulator